MKLRVLAGAATAALVAAALTNTTNLAATAAEPGDTAVSVDAGAANAAALPDKAFTPAARAEAIASFQKSAPTVARSLRLPTGTDLAVKDVMKDAGGSVHVRYTRSYNGLPVIGGDFVVHDAQQSSTADVTWDTAGNFSALPTKPGISADQASAAAGAPAGSSKLVVWGVSGKPRLAYQTVVAAANGLHTVVVTDAADGSAIVSYDKEQTSDAAGTGKTLYSGNVTIRTDKLSATNYRMRDLTRGGHRVTSMNNTEDTESTTLTDADNVWGNNSESSPQSAAADAQYGAAATWDFYQSLGRSGIRNDGVGARSRVHFGTDYDNAFWDDECFCMTYGDGDQFLPLVELDVAGHEMSHGVTSNTAGLLYFGESGGLNEATSDIFGTSVEFTANNASDPGDYYIGEKIASGFPGGALRRMDKPSLDGASFDCYTPLMGRNDVHYTSGVANHFFYLLSEGSGSKTIGGLPHNSPVCTGPAVTGMGRAGAAKIWYRALTTYLVPGSDYRAARDATIRASLDLFNAATCQKVTKAWTALKVPAGQWTCAGETTPPTGTNAVANGGFEASPSGSGWTQVGPLGAPIGQYGVFNSGVTAAYLRGYGTAGTDSVAQTITVPATGTPKLVYYLLVDSSETSSTKAFDKFKVVITKGSTSKTVQTSDNTKWDDSWHRLQVSLAAYAGQTVTLKFVGTEDSSAQSGFVVDDVSVQSY